MVHFSFPTLVRKAIGADKDWPQQWAKPEPKSDFDVIIVGAGGHGLGAAYYLAKEHGITNVADINHQSGKSPLIATSGHFAQRNHRSRVGVSDHPLQPSIPFEYTHGSGVRPGAKCSGVLAGGGLRTEQQGTPGAARSA